MRSIARISVVLSVALASFAGASRAEAQVGVAAGLNFGSLGDIEVLDATATFDNASGYHVGVFYDLGLGPVGLRLGAYYRDLGEFDADGIAGELGAIELSMFDFPVDVRINLSATPAITPYVLVGPVFSIPSSDNEFVEDELPSVMVSGNVGLGLYINLGGLRLLPEVRYVIGVTSLIEEGTEVGGFELNTDDTRLNSAMLRLGVMF